MSVESLDDHGRSAIINVAGPVALLVAKLHKLGERVPTPNRRNDKDAHDIYRLRVATDNADLATTVRGLEANEISNDVTAQALGYLEQLFASADALGATMGGPAEEGVGQPDTVSASVSLLAQDLLSALA